MNAYIKIVKYKGRAGGFAHTETDRYSTYLVNEDKNFEHCIDEWQCSGFGYSKLSYATQVAEPYRKLFDLPTKFFERKEETKTVLVDTVVDSF